MSQILPPGGPRHRERSQGIARATTGQRIAVAIALFLAVAVVAAVWIVPATPFADTVISIVLSPFIFIGGLWTGTLAGWARAGWLLPDLAFRLSLATVSGIGSGLLIAWLQRGYEEHRDSRVNKSLISALFSREIWVSQLPTTLMLFLVVGLGSFAASSAIDAVVVSSAHPGLSIISAAVTGGSGGGFDAIYRLQDLIIAVAALLGAGLAFGAVTGFFAGLPAGALYGLLAHIFQWPDLIQGAAEGATASASARSMYGARDRPHYISRILMSAIIGGIEGALGGAIAAVLMCGLRAVGLI